MIMSRDAVIIDWRERKAFKRAMRALRLGEVVVLRCGGWRGRLLHRFLPKWLDANAMLGWTELFIQFILLRLVTVCTYAEASKRPIAIQSFADALVVRFESVTRKAPSDDDGLR